MRKEEGPQGGPSIGGTEILGSLLKGLISRYTDLKTMITPELAATVKETSDALLPDLETSKIEDPFDYMEILVKAVNKDSVLGAISCERLGSLGVKLITGECQSGATPALRKKILGPICPKALFLVLLLKNRFPKRQIKMDYSGYTKKGAETEVLFQ